MKKEKLYFRGTYSEKCYPLEYHLKEAKENGLSKITLIYAIPENDVDDVIFCKLFDVTDKSYCSKKQCDSYTSKSGRGKCSNKGRLFTYGYEETFNV